MKITTEISAYVAGILDGEGYLGIMERHKERKTHDYLPVVKVANTDKELITWLKSLFGGWISAREFPSGTNSKPAFCLTIAGRKVVPLLTTTLPFLRIKKRQAKLLLKRAELYQHLDLGRKSNSNLSYPVEVRQRIQNLYRQIRILNHRGRQPERLSEGTPHGDAIV